MNLEDQCVSFELAKKLLNLGVKQKSIFIWEYFDYKCHGIKYIPYAVVPHEFNNCKLYPAFTSSELLAMLPNRITINENEPFNSFRLKIEKSFYVKEKVPDDKIINLLEISKNIKEVYLVNYRCDSTECSGENAWLERTLFDHNIYDENPANAFAKALIYLIENGMINYENIH